MPIELHLNLSTAIYLIITAFFGGIGGSLGGEIGKDYISPFFRRVVKKLTGKDGR